MIDDGARKYRIIGGTLVAIGIMAGFLAAAAMDGSSKLLTILSISLSGMCALVSGALLLSAANRISELWSDLIFWDNLETKLRGDDNDDAHD